MFASLRASRRETGQGEKIRSKAMENILGVCTLEMVGIGNSGSKCFAFCCSWVASPGLHRAVMDFCLLSCRRCRG